MAIYGVQPYGVGTPTVAQDLGGLVLKDSTVGDQQGSRQIDPLTRDYVLSSTCRVQGMSDAKQLVYLAVNTTKGSAAMRSLGQELMKIDRITSNFAHRVDSTLRAAVQFIVDKGLIEVIETQVSIVRPGVAKVRLRWRDLSDGIEDVTSVGA